MENEELMEKVKMKRLYILWQELGINILIFYGNIGHKLEEILSYFMAIFIMPSINRVWHCN